MHNRKRWFGNERGFITGAILAGTSAFGTTAGIFGAKSAADQQAAAAQAALDFQKQVFQQQQQNIQPWLQAGGVAIGQLGQDIGNGTFGPGSIGPPPSFTGQFKAPTLAEAEQTPGYQFQFQQGLKALDQGAAARGGLGTGGELTAENQYGQGLAASNYSNIFNQALQTYGAGLQGYQAQMQNYQAKLAAQAQAYNQLAGVAGTGQTAVQNLNNTGTQFAQNAGNLMTQIGNANAAGTVGVANALSGGANNLAQNYLISQFLQNKGTQPGYSAAIGNGGAPIPSSYGQDGSALYGNEQQLGLGPG